MNVKLEDSEKIKVLNSDDLYGIMQRVLLREEKIDQDGSLELSNVLRQATGRARVTISGRLRVAYGWKNG